MSGRDDRSAGASPHSIATTDGDAAGEQQHRAVERHLRGNRHGRHETAAQAAATPGPSTPSVRAPGRPAVATTAISAASTVELTGDRARGSRRAPRAARFPSGDRSRARSSRWLTLTHAISSTTPTAANNSTSAGRDAADHASPAPTRCASVRPACVFGSAASSRWPMTSRSAFAAAKLTPGFSRPTPSSCPARPRAARAASDRRATGRNRSTPPMK